MAWGAAGRCNGRRRKRREGGRKKLCSITLGSLFSRFFGYKATASRGGRSQFDSQRCVRPLMMHTCSTTIPTYAMGAASPAVASFASYPTSHMSSESRVTDELIPNPTEHAKDHTTTILAYISYHSERTEVIRSRLDRSLRDWKLHRAIVIGAARCLEMVATSVYTVFQTYYIV